MDSMRQRPETLLRKCVVLGVVAAIAVTGSWLMSASWCLFQECIEDDASRRAAALVGDTLVVVYAVLTLVAVFLPALRLHRAFAMPVAAAIPSLAVAAGFIFLFIDPKIDGAAGILALGLWLAGPWFVASLIGLAVWPKAKAGAAGVELNCFD